MPSGYTAHLQDSDCTLGYFDLGSNSEDNVMDLGKLTNLQDLHLTCPTVQPADNLENNMKCLGSILGKLSSLKCLALVPAEDSSHVNTLQDDAGASSMSISCDGLSSVSPAPALLERLELLPRICIFPSIPKWFGELGRLCILKIAVRELSREDIHILKELPVLTALSLYVWTAPPGWIIFDEGFGLLEYFKFMCTAPYMSFVEGAMPNVRKIKLGFNANRMKRHRPVTFGFRHLKGLRDISIKFGGAGADESKKMAEYLSKLEAIVKHPINVKFVDRTFFGEQDKSSVTEGQEVQQRCDEDVNKKIDSRERERARGRSMEYVAIITPVLRVLKVLHDTIDKHKGIETKLKTGVRSLRNEMKLIGKDIKRYEEQELQELAYDIEDFLPHLLKPGWLDFILARLALDRGTEKVGIIDYFKERIEKLEKRQQSQRGEASGSTSGASGASRMNRDTELVGRVKNEFLELLSAADNGQMRVISIVGCSGLGKTALARALYHDPSVADEFDCKAWVVASECIDDAEGLLNKIFEQIRAESATTSHFRQPKIEELHFLLRNKRYLLVIDDMLKAQLWDDVKSAFPNTAGSRIIVTTSIQSIATYLSRSSHRFKMPCLDIDSSRNLLLKEMDSPLAKPPPSIAEGRILSKCDGLPLALVSVANHLRPDPTDDNCRDVEQAFGTFIAGSAQAFGELKRALVQCYDSLPDYHDRRCLLSVSMFPQGHQINRKSLLRRWIAEGLVAGEGQRYDVDVASKTFREFVNRSIIDPVLLTGNNSEVKTCRVQGTMLEFIVHKSTCTTNFLTLIHKDDRLPKEGGAHPLRRLSVHGDTKQIASFANKIGVSVIRWLAICRCSSIPFDLSKCKLLRVLDLEDCKELDDKVLASICELEFLKYLSLRGSDVKEIPKKITELVNLETLDIRDTQVKKLPMEVIMMPGLVHLFGRFQLTKPNSFLPKMTRKYKQKTDMEKFFSEKSKLQALAGVDIDKEDQGFREIMLHAKKLKKVKIWCKTTSRNLIPTKRFTGSESLESLSVNSSDHPIDFLSDGFLDSLNGSCAIRSLKLRGVLGGLPDTLASFRKLNGLSELQLFSTGLSSEALSILQKISCLLYLKLAEDRHDFGDGSFVVQEDGFPSLQRLCIKAPGLPKLQFEKGAMPRLTSLELLLCPRTSLQTGATSEISSPQPDAPLQTGATSEVTSLQPEAPLQNRITPEISSAQPEAPLQTRATAEIERHLGVEGISHLAQLDEVILHHSAPDATMEAWKEAAKRHINRPYVKKHLNPNSDTA